MDNKRVGELVDAPGPCHHKNVNPFVIEVLAPVRARPNIPPRLRVRCPVKNCDNMWYIVDPLAEHIAAYSN